MKKIIEYKTPSDSKIIKTEVVCPNDTNPMGLLKGGRLVEWMDMAAAVCAQIHSEKICVTVSVNHIDFHLSAKVGDIIFLEATITRTFTTSMEIRVLAFSQNILKHKKILAGEAILTFVALDEEGKTSKVIAMKPISTSEIEQHENALSRRNIKKNFEYGKQTK